MIDACYIVEHYKYDFYINADNVIDMYLYCVTRIYREPAACGGLAEKS